MPDTIPSPYIDNSVIGFDPLSNLQIQTDTYNRLSPIMDQQDHPYSSPDAYKGIGMGVQSKLPNISILDAITSKDPNIQAMGQRAVEQDMRNTIPEYRMGLGQTLETPAALGEKYLNKKYGFSALRDNENMYYDYRQQDTTLGGRIIGNVATILGRLAGETVTKLGEGLGYMGSMITSIGKNDYFGHVADNGFSKWFQNQEDWLKNDLLPVYKQAGFDQKGFFAKLFTPETWTDDVVDAAAFMSSFAVQTLLTGGVGDLLGLGKFGSLGINTASKLGKFGKGLDLGIKFMTGADDIAGIGNWALNTASESFFESAGVYKETKQDFLDARARGELNYTDDQINAIASERASHDFKGNLLALSVSNAFENKFLFQPLKRFIKGTAGAAAEREAIDGVRINVADVKPDIEQSLKGTIKEFNYSTKAGKFLDWKNPKGKLQFYGTRAVGASIMEGLYEENIQLAMERLSRYGQYENKNLFQAWAATAEQTGHQAVAAAQGKDPEAAMSIGLGALIGIVGVTGISKMFGGQRFLQGERRSEIARAQEVLNKYNKVKTDFLNDGDVFQTDEAGKPLVDKNGHLVYDEEKITARAAGLREFLGKAVLDDGMLNPVSRKLVQNHSIAAFVAATEQAGMTAAVLGKIEGVKNKSPEEIRALGFNPADVRDNPEALAAKIRAHAEIYREDMKSTTMRPKGVSSTEYAINENVRRYYLYDTHARTLAAQEAHDSVQAQITAQNVKQAPSNLDIDPVVQAHNSALVQLILFNQFAEKAQENGSFYDDHIAKRRDELIDKITELRQSLHDKFSVMEGDKSVNPLSEDLNGLVFHSIDDNDTNVEDHIDIPQLKQLAGSRNAIEQNNYTSAKIGSLRNGYENFKDFQLWEANVLSKSADEDENKEIPVERQLDYQPIQENKFSVVPRDGVFHVVSPTGSVITQYTTQEEADAAVVKLNEVPPPPPPPPPPDPVELDEEPADEVNPLKPLAYMYPSMTSKDDTVNITPSHEQISTDNYSLMRADFVKEVVNDVQFGENYRVFMVKDTFSEVYAENDKKSNEGLVQKVEGKWQFTDLNDPRIGEVLIVQNTQGKQIFVGDIASLKAKYPEQAGLPIVFSSDKLVFFGPLYSDRVATKSRKMKMTPVEVETENRDLQKQEVQARKELKAGEKERIEVKVMLVSEGVHPRTKTIESVQKRFGDFEIEVVKPTVAGMKVSNQFEGRYSPGTVVATVEGQDFPVTTLKISSDPNLLKQIEGTLRYTFNSLEAAQNVRANFLEVMVNTNAVQFFTLDYVEGNYKINFRRAKEADIKSGDENRMRDKALPANELIGDARINVSAKALKGGYLNFNPETGASPFPDRGDYEAFIKPKIVTSYKKVTDKQGKLYMKPVNPSFSFVIADVSSGPNQIQNENYQKLQKNLFNSDGTQANQFEEVKGRLEEFLQKGQITQEQHDNLQKRIKESKPAGVGADTFITNNERRRKEELEGVTDAAEIAKINKKYDTALAFASKNKPKVEEKAVEVKTEKGHGDRFKQEVDISKIVAGKADPNPGYSTDKFLYNPETNTLLYITSNTKVRKDQIARALEELHSKHGYAGNKALNTGFDRIELGDYIVYRPPNPRPNTEMAVKKLADGKFTTEDVTEVMKHLSPENKTLLSQFLNKYC